MCDNPNKINLYKKKKKKKRGGRKRKMTVEQSMAHRCVSEWVFLGQSSTAASPVVGDDFAVNPSRFSEKLGFELHSHSNCSDGFLSPSKLVERAHLNGVNSFALFSFLIILFIEFFGVFFRRVCMPVFT